MTTKNSAEKKSMRVFFAFDIDDSLRSASAKIIKHLQKQPHGDQIRWVDAENLHVTLRFLGEVETSKIDELIKQVKQEIKEIKPFSVSVGKIMGFPPRHPHTISLMFTFSEELAKLVFAIETAVNRCGFEPEQRAFSPHLTFGRLRSSRLPEVENLPIKIPEKIDIEEIILFRSDQNENGSVYTPLTKIALKVEVI